MSADDMTLLWHYVDKWAKEKPDGEALVYEDERISWKDFNAQVDLCAKAMLAAGVGKGDRIAMVAMARPEFMVTFMAASKIGATWLGLSPKFSIDELRYVIGHSEPTVLITVRSYMDMDLVEAGITFGLEFPFINQVLVIGEPHPKVTDYHEFVNQPREDLDAALVERAAQVSDEDEVLLMYTSGSTGRPKGVLQTHRSIVENIKVEVEHMLFQDDTRVLMHFPINHVAADVEIGFGTIFGGGTIVMMDRFDPETSLDMVEKERITMLGQVPVMFLMQMQTPKFKDMDWSSVRIFVWGGAGAPKLMLDVLAQIASKTGAVLMTGYGSTELCGFTTYSSPDDDLETLAASCGKAVPPFEMKIVDTERNEVPAGEVGEIAFRGPMVMKGYLKNPQATNKVLDAEGWYYTSDLGRVDDKGNLYISGRSSEMFKTGGENVFPREVEDVLESHPAVLFAAVIGVPDDMYQEVGHAFIMLKPGQQTTDEELRAHAKSRLANFKVPKKFDLRPILPLLPNGKVNKMELKGELGLTPAQRA